MKSSDILLLLCLMATPLHAVATTLQGGGIQRNEYRVEIGNEPAPSNETTIASGSDFASIESQLLATFDQFRRELGGVTFGIDQATGNPPLLEGGLQDAILDMIKKSPERW